MLNAPPGGVLALDLSSHVGVALGGIFSTSPAFCTWHLPKNQGEGARYAAFENELAACIDRLQPARVVLESAMSLQAMAQVSTTAVMRQQITLRGIAYSEAYRASIPISEISADFVRGAMLGQSRFEKGKVKAAVIAYCHGRDWMCLDDNQADACLTWAWHCTQMRGGAPVSGPLFAVRGGG